MKHAEVPEALELVVDEVGKESQRIRDAGSVALKEGKLKPAKKAIEYAEKLLGFVEKVRELGDEWERLQHEIDGFTPEVREIVLPTKIRNHKTGYTINAGSKSPKTTFSVSFPDGTVIADNGAKVVFGKAISKLGTSRVAAFGIMLGGEPLLSRDKSIFKKNPGQVHPIGDGWYVKTHCSTAAKIGLLKKIAAKMNVRIGAIGKEWQTGGTSTEKTTPEPQKIVQKADGMRSSRPKSAAKKFPYAVGKVVQAVFPALQTDMRMTEAHVATLVAQSSSAHFKTGGWPVLKPNTGKADEIKDTKGVNRYYNKIPLNFFGRKYWLTSQFAPHGIMPMLEWLEGIGLKKDEILAICQGRWG